MGSKHDGDIAAAAAEFSLLPSLLPCPFHWKKTRQFKQKNVVVIKGDKKKVKLQ